MKKILWEGLGFAIGVTVYVSLVVGLMMNLQNVLGVRPGQEFIGGLVILLLFVLSAAVVGSLIFGRPVYLYFSGEKKQSVLLVASTIVWLLVCMVLALVIAVAGNLH